MGRVYLDVLPYLSNILVLVAVKYMDVLFITVDFSDVSQQ